MGASADNALVVSESITRDATRVDRSHQVFRWVVRGFAVLSGLTGVAAVVFLLWSIACLANGFWSSVIRS